MIYRIIFLSLLLIFGCSSADKIDKKAIQKNQSDSPVKLLFAGDVMLDWGIEETIQTNGYSYPLEELKTFLEGFDYRFCNLECPISDEGDVHPDKKYVFLARPERIKLLLYGGINGISLANNHACDFGKKGLLNTIDNLQKNDIAFTGGGENMNAARTPISIKKNDIKIAIFAYTTIEYDDSFAGENSPGVARGNIEIIKEDINKHRKNYDIIAISLHWGDEYSEYPADEQIADAHEIIKSGADVIIGHHPHIFQGIEIYKNKPIFYSLGNFIFGSINEDIKENILVELRVTKDGLQSFIVYPINGNGSIEEPFKYKILKNDMGNNAIKHLLKISKRLKSNFTAKAAIKNSTIVYYFDNE